MDIEDIHIEAEPARITSKDGVVKTRFSVKKRRPSQISVDDLQLESNLPEKHHIFVQTWGCAHNTSDSEYMAGLLAQYGYQVTLGGSQSRTEDTSEHSDCPGTSCDCESAPNGDCCQTDTDRTPSVYDNDEKARQQAGLWVLNSCTVKGPAEDHFRNAVAAGLRSGKLVVVAGCVPQGRPGTDYLKGVSMIGVQQIDRVVEVVEETLQGNTVRFLDKKCTPSEANSPKRRLGGAPLDLPKIRRNPLIEILAISTGCLNACTYCKTKHARGVLASYPIGELLERAKQAFADGVKELWLTSEDLGAYGRDLDRSNSEFSCPTIAKQFPNVLTLSDLLAGLVRLIPAGCMLRLGMTNPPYILEQLQEIADVLSHPRVYAFLHVPVQSGSDAVLDRMKREYTAEEFAHVVTFLREQVRPPPLPPSSPPNTVNGSGALTVATDIICGFPNETDADFEETVKMIEEYQFPVLYINQFFARPGTPAANMPRKATTAQVKKRTRRLHDLFRTYRPYENRVGALVRVLVTETSHDGRYFVGHTKAYEQVLVPKETAVYGNIILVRIMETDKFFMRSEIVDYGPFDSLVFEDAAGGLKPEVLPNLPILEELHSPEVDSFTARQQIPSLLHSMNDSNSQWVFRLGIILLLGYFVLKLFELGGHVPRTNVI